MRGGVLLVQGEPVHVFLIFLRTRHVWDLGTGLTRKRRKLGKAGGGGGGWAREFVQEDVVVDVLNRSRHLLRVLGRQEGVQVVRPD